MLTNIHFFNHLVKQGLEDICLISSYPAVDFILENYHLVRELFLNGIVYHPKLPVRRRSMVSKT